MSTNYDGGGSTTVGACISSGNNYCYHNAEGTNLIRMCVYSGCNDDNDDNFRTAAMYTRAAHTIYGHAKA